jgi:hypothetical protein
MVGMAGKVNARLRENNAAGHELDATHAPDITLLQRFVRAKDLDAMTGVATKGFGWPGAGALKERVSRSNSCIYRQRSVVAVSAAGLTCRRGRRWRTRDRTQQGVTEEQLTT